MIVLVMPAFPVRPARHGEHRVSAASKIFSAICSVSAMCSVRRAGAARAAHHSSAARIYVTTSKFPWSKPPPE
jgi:hypothetical protein